MLLYHSFPRPKEARPGRKSARDEPNPVCSRGLATLSSILGFGLLCTPETIEIYADRKSKNVGKQILLAAGKPAYSLKQSRLCLTLSTGTELYETTIRGLVPGADGPVAGAGPDLSHADLFGPFAIGFDPLVARRAGIVPTIYYAPNDMFGGRFRPDRSQIPGLNIQLIQRLNALRELMIGLSYIEGRLAVRGLEPVLPPDELRRQGLTLPFNPEIATLIDEMTEEQMRLVLRFTSIDRYGALDLVDFTDVLLNLFQETDSSIDHTVLAFFQQREWRLVFCWRPGTDWCSLGEQPPYRTSSSAAAACDARALRRILTETFRGERSDVYWKDCWLLREIDGEKPRQLIKQVIVPEAAFAEAKSMLREARCSAELVVAESLGFSWPTSQPSED